MKKQEINPTNKEDRKCFLYAVIVALNYGEIKKNPETTTKIKPLINK